MQIKSYFLSVKSLYNYKARFKMDVDRQEIVTTIRSISQDMQAPITLEELMKELQCNQSGVVKECINDLSSANDM